MRPAAHKSDQKICEAALRLAALQEWDKVTLEQIARAAKIPARDIKARFTATADILPLIISNVTLESFKACGKPKGAASAHERLFDTLMARFDQLQKHRKAILSISRAALRQPNLPLILLPAQLDTMKKTLEFAGIKTQKTCDTFASIGLLGVFLATFRVWKEDETLDMSKTMAALDRYLRYTDRAVTLLRIKFV